MKFFQSLDELEEGKEVQENAIDILDMFESDGSISVAGTKFQSEIG